MKDLEIYEDNSSEAGEAAISPYARASSADAGTDYKKEVEKLQRKLAKRDAELEDLKSRYRVAETRLSKTEVHMEDQVSFWQEKARKTKQKLGEIVQKENKIKVLVDTIRLSVQQGKIELSNRKLSRSVMLRERLSKLANTLADLFGGMVFVAPLDVPENAALSSAKNSGRKFLTYVWSNTAKPALKEMGVEPGTAPMLEKAPIFQYVIDNRNWYFPDLKLVTFPKRHPTLTTALLLPIVVDGKSLGICGFANGTYTAEDAQVLFSSVPTAWMSIISESVKDSSNNLLVNTLPSFVVDKLLNDGGSYRSGKSGMSTATEGGLVMAERYEEVSMLFIDIVGFTKLTKGMPPENLVRFINKFFWMIDEIAEHYPVEKIKTIGDAYMLVCGIPNHIRDHAETTADLALEILGALDTFNDENEFSIQIRIGISSGPVVGGIIGKTKFAFDVWGETVNKASRMESTGMPNKIQVTEETYNMLKHYPTYKLEPRGKVSVHGMGQLNTWFLTRNYTASSTQQVHMQIPANLDEGTQNIDQHTKITTTKLPATKSSGKTSPTSLPRITP